MHQKILQQTRGNAGGKETTTKKHCVVKDKMQSFILSPAICGKMFTRHKIQKRNFIQHIDLQQQAFVGQLRGPTNEYRDLAIFVKN